MDLNHELRLELDAWQEVLTMSDNQITVPKEDLTRLLDLTSTLLQHTAAVLVPLDYSPDPNSQPHRNGR